MLYGASRSKTAWSIHLADIIGVGHLFRTGQIFTKRIVSLAGPQVAKPRLVEIRMGAFLDEVVAGELKEGENRVISGSPLSGRTSMGELHGYLGRHHRQITVLEEGREREFLGWLAPGGNKFSSIPIFLSALFGGKKFNFTTTTNGEHREMVPIGMYERVMPLDIIPTFLLRSLEINDLERAEQLGALELDEEDVALCSFVCPGKQDYSVHLRRVLNQIYKEG
jgi:Na+-transporting NADH:ubiquinone oxidoreductase subunit A